MDLERFRELPIVGIVRGQGSEPVEELIETVIGAGLTSLEITMNTPNAGDLIRRAAASAGGRMAIGAGTVLDTEQLAVALDAGASFIVMPTLVHEVVESCAERGIPVFPGALTPQEISDAWRAGATMVKVFPAKFFGPPYFREIKGPFHDIELLACGGVDSSNLADFFAAGASAVAFGGSIFKPSWIDGSGLDHVAAAIAELLQAYRQHSGDT